MELIDDYIKKEYFLCNNISNLYIYIYILLVSKNKIQIYFDILSQIQITNFRDKFFEVYLFIYISNLYYYMYNLKH